MDKDIIACIKRKGENISIRNRKTWGDVIE